MFSLYYNRVHVKTHDTPLLYMLQTLLKIHENHKVFFLESQCVQGKLQIVHFFLRLSLKHCKSRFVLSKCEDREHWVMIFQQFGYFHVVSMLEIVSRLELSEQRILATAQRETRFGTERELRGAERWERAAGSRHAICGCRRAPPILRTAAFRTSISQKTGCAAPTPPDNTISKWQKRPRIDSVILYSQRLKWTWLLSGLFTRRDLSMCGC